ncbi:hypothetical protein HNQ94_003315 [Salirhabdus euzebyi]|uniref:3-ketoacyl-ACP reductase n=1 Tax=Salirhabdus euzebyi TaxID=394506 RepID=A0A841Q8V4_9BACI|nr:SDR family oxidoreductase [Salirhabdus euzebyi]MBB6454826.1 hypothetical protein [Salirhabdus euzebyi]
MNFTNDTVLITGSSNGIGKGLAYSYANKNAKVIIADVDEKNGLALKKELQGLNTKAFFIRCDFSSQESIQNLFSTIDRNEEISSPTILINNVGVSSFYNFFDMSFEQWNKVIQTNLSSVFLCTQKMALRWKRNQMRGRIVNIASTRAFMSEPNSEAYAASKGGIIAITHALAQTLSVYGIQVNSISPGWIQTTDYDQLREIDHKQHPSLRVGHPLDIAKACFYLTDPENNFVTGENIVVDGGMTRKMIYEH